jgi:hypothetical protein
MGDGSLLEERGEVDARGVGTKLWTYQQTRNGTPQVIAAPFEEEQCAAEK